jgi:eukaryotic-like serine/threonine-protein kinase
MDSTPVVIGNTLYIGCAGGVIYVLNTLNGKPRWIFNASGDVDSEASVSNGVVYVDSRDSSDENTTLSAIRSP